MDNRAGSKDLYPLLRAKGLPVTLTRLDYADVSFLGTGPEGEPVSIGVEVKTIRDVINSLATGRFAGHQLPGLIASYDQSWLLIEGLWRSNAKTGLLEYRRARGTWDRVTAGSRQFMYRDLVTWLFTMQIKGGVSVTRCSDWNEATVWLCTLYQWWTQKDGKAEGWESHKSHLAFHDGTRNGTPYKRDRATQMVSSLSDKALLTRPTLCRMVAAQLPSIGWEKSRHIAKRYKTVEELCSATPDELMELEGIGPTLANGIYQSLRSFK